MTLAKVESDSACSSMNSTRSRISFTSSWSRVTSSWVGTTSFEWDSSVTRHLGSAGRRGGGRRIESRGPSRSEREGPRDSIRLPPPRRPAEPRCRVTEESHSNDVVPTQELVTRLQDEVKEMRERVEFMELQALSLSTFAKVIA